MKIKKHFSNRTILSIIDIEKVFLKLEMIKKVLEMFDFDNVIIVIDCFENNSSFFEQLEILKMDYKKIIGKNNSFDQCIVKVARDKLNILEYVSLESDLVFIDCNNKFLSANDFGDILDFQFDKMIIDENSNFWIDVWNSEQQIRIGFNSKKYDQNDIFKKIKNILN